MTFLKTSPRCRFQFPICNWIWVIIANSTRPRSRPSPGIWTVFTAWLWTISGMAAAAVEHRLILSFPFHSLANARPSADHSPLLFVALTTSSITYLWGRRWLGEWVLHGLETQYAACWHPRIRLERQGWPSQPQILKSNRSKLFQIALCRGSDKLRVEK